MYTENYSPEEINRIKKIIEIGESQKQIKKSDDYSHNTIILYISLFLLAY